MADRIYRFGQYCLDTGERRLLRGDEVVPLRGKVFDTLRVLVENHGRLVRKEELLKAVWPDSIVEENSLDHNVSAIRKALGQERGGIKYIETAQRQGYRFVAAVETSGAPAADDQCLVERENQLSQLRAALVRVSSSRRQVIFITGEPGIGKTALARAFTYELAAADGIRVARGHCQDHHGEGEPYMPVLEALGRLVREDDAVLDVLARCAPSWVAQFPHAVSAPPPSLGITTERMLREMADAMEVLAARQKLVFVLEDLHWADYSSIDLLARIAQRTEPARLLVIGTYRPSDAKARSHPLHGVVHQLKLRGSCMEIPLGYLSPEGVAQYLRARLSCHELPADVAKQVYARTRGNPLFVATVVNSWLATGSLRDIEQLANGIPYDLRVMIEHQVMELEPEDQEIIEAASVAGALFCPAAIAPALERPTLEIEARCASLAKNGRFFVAAGAQDWPDGTVCEAYQFFHSVHRDVVYERLPAGRRVKLHQQIANRLEEGYRGCTDEIVAELAAHFREARDAPRALRYLQRAAEQALTRSAHHEAIDHLKSALSMLGRLPVMSDRARRERDILTLLGPALVMTKGFADPEAEDAIHRAYELATALDGCSAHFPVVFGLAVMLEVRGHYAESQMLLERHLPEQERSGEFLLETRDILACSRFHQGAFKNALEHGEKGAMAWSPEKHSLVSAAFGEDPGIDCHTWVALSLWFLGYPDRALRMGRLAVALAGDPTRPYSLAYTQTQLATLHQLRQEHAAALDWAEEAIALATKQGYVYRCAVAQVLRGWALSCLGRSEEGIRTLQEGMNGCAAIGAEVDRPYYLALLAEAQLNAGRPAEAVASLEDALSRVAATPTFFYLAEIYRLRGAAAIDCRQDPSVAEQWFRRALELAESQGARSLELRAALSLAGLNPDAGQERLEKAYAQFDEGSELPELRQAAKRLRRLAVTQSSLP